MATMASPCHAVAAAASQATGRPAASPSPSFGSSPAAGTPRRRSVGAAAAGPRKSSGGRKWRGAKMEVETVYRRVRVDRLAPAGVRSRWPQNAAPPEREKREL